jgi:hypothetical protein
MYSQFLDGATGKTLCAEPGGLYDIAPAAGSEGMVIPPDDGQWGAERDTPKDAPKKSSTETKAAPKGRAGSSAAPAAKGD